MIHITKSCGLYSSWWFHAPSRTLFDCGPGIAFDLRAKIFAVERICISHCHFDHINGLIEFISARASTKGDNAKKLDIYIPTHDLDPRAELLLNYVASLRLKRDFELCFHFQKNVDELISSNWRLRSFKMVHGGCKVVGYKIVETRQRLKKEFLGQDIKALKIRGVDVYDSYDKNIFAYCLDSCGFDFNEIRECDEVVMDCTFLDAADRDELTHFTLDEAVEACAKAGVKTMYAAHISPRYPVGYIFKTMAKKNYGDKVVAIFNDKVYAF